MKIEIDKNIEKDKILTDRQTDRHPYGTLITYD